MSGQLAISFIRERQRRGSLTAIPIGLASSDCGFAHESVDAVGGRVLLLPVFGRGVPRCRRATSRPEGESRQLMFPVVVEHLCETDARVRTLHSAAFLERTRRHLLGGRPGQRSRRPLQRRPDAAHRGRGRASRQRAGLGGLPLGRGAVLDRPEGQGAGADVQCPIRDRRGPAGLPGSPGEASPDRPCGRVLRVAARPRAEETALLHTPSRWPSARPRGPVGILA